MDQKKNHKDSKSPQIDLQIQSNHDKSLSKFGGHGNLMGLF